LVIPRRKVILRTLFRRIGTGLTWSWYPIFQRGTRGFIRRRIGEKLWALFKKVWLGEKDLGKPGPKGWVFQFPPRMLKGRRSCN